jgi:hypothetical protein
MPRKICGIEFEYSSKKREGIIYWLGAFHGTTEWKNPCDLKLIKVYSSSIDKGDPKALLDKNPSELWTQDIPASWIYIDLGDYSVQPYAYSLRHGGNYIADSLRNWDFQGSADGEHWETLKRHRKDESIHGKYDEKHWKIDINEGIGPFKMFRIKGLVFR